MNLKSKLAALAVAFLSFGALAEGISFEHISLDEALEKAKAEDKPIFIDIYASWCGPCKYLSREVFVEEELGAYMNENFINLKLDGEQGDGDYLMTEFGLDAFPTMLFLSADKEELNRIVGAVSAEEILEASKGVIDPTSTELYQLKSQFDAGNRDKEVMLRLISEMLDHDEEYEPVLYEYLEFYPDLDLTDEKEFLVFCLGINDLKDPLNREFLDDIERFNETFPELTQAKMSILIYSTCEEAQKKDDNSLIDDAVAQLTEPLNQIIEETVSENDLRELMLEAISEM